ncbi:hypothetical protein HanPSC8_Chr02g0051141 [Helianthus annuus]|nr:hypothetical protein HanPSC8_Chr02g0051141 [Helianthus annuus]
MVLVIYQNFGFGPDFLKVHGWSLWFAFCNAFSPFFPKVHG